jgi:hypothetical protein
VARAFSVSDLSPTSTQHQLLHAIAISVCGALGSPAAVADQKKTTTRMKGHARRRYELLLLIRAPVQFAEGCERVERADMSLRYYLTAMFFFSQAFDQTPQQRKCSLSQSGSRMPCNATQSPWVRPPVTIMWAKARIDHD